MLSPVASHLSEEIWQAFFPGKSVHLSSWPAEGKEEIDGQAEAKAAFLNEVAAKARQHKADRKLPLNSEIASAKISCDFDIGEIEEEIHATGKVKVINAARGERSIEFS